MNYLRVGLYGLVGLLFMSAVFAVQAAPAPAPGLVDLGFTDFRASGYTKAFATWAYGGPLAQDANYGKRLVASTSFWNSLGRCRSYDEVDAQPISNRSTVVTLTAQFDRGEVFFRFIVYNDLGRSSITSIDWATDPALLADWR
ncbi:MAG: hypothetical protein B9S26_15265 [Opitutia bacterium Tous-C4FEB]|nr:MAG: hypothetical protein B9S26_15265 [Opitutae bacterium Tous-C4FEB]